jgi:hypothetical protein
MRLVAVVAVLIFENNSLHGMVEIWTAQAIKNERVSSMSGN